MSRGTNYDELVTWRLIGTFVWQLGASVPWVLLWTLCATAGLRSLLTWRAWFTAAAFLVAQAPVVLAHRLFFLPQLDPPPDQEATGRKPLSDKVRLKLADINKKLKLKLKKAQSDVILKLKALSPFHKTPQPAAPAPALGSAAAFGSAFTPGSAAFAPGAVPGTGLPPGAAPLAGNAPPAPAAGAPSQPAPLSVSWPKEAAKHWICSFSLVVVYMLCGAVCMWILQPPGGMGGGKAARVRGAGARGEATHGGWAEYGALVGLAQAAALLLHGDCALLFPSLLRHRYFRIKLQLPQAVESAARTAVIALGLQLVVFLSVGSLMSRPAFWQLAWRVITGALVSYTWSMGCVCLEVVHTERHQFLSEAPGAGPEEHWRALVHAARLPAAPLVRHLAFHDLALVAAHAAHRGTQDWRRRAIFASPSGQVWKEVGGLCVEPVEALVAALAPVAAPLVRLSHRAGLEAAAAPPQLTAGATSAATWHLRCNFQICAWAAASLGHLAAGAKQDDHYGQMQLFQPSVGRIASALLSALLALRVCVSASVYPQLPSQDKLATLLGLFPRVPLPRASVGHRAGRSAAYGPGAANMLAPLQRPCAALGDLVQLALYQLVVAYGEPLITDIAATKPAFGTLADHRGLLHSIIETAL